jgi:hypothetical protein
MLDENRLALIRRWGMDGAHDDLGIRLDPPPDLEAITGERDEPPAVGGLQLPVFMKPAGGDGWQPLVAEPTLA